LPWRVITILLLGIPAASVLAFAVTWRLPRDSWSRIEPSPEKLVRFVDVTAFGFLSGEVVAEGESGATYAYSCQQRCNWSAVTAKEGIPASDKPLDSCGSGQVDRQLTPLALFRVRDRTASRFCGRDYSISTYFLLDQDGQVWAWIIYSGLYDGMFMFFCHIFGGVVVAAAACVSADVVIGRRRSSDSSRQVSR